MRELKTRFDSRYSFQSLIIEGSIDLSQSSRLSSSVQDIFDSLHKNMNEPTNKMLFKHLQIIICFMAVAISMLFVSFQEQIIIQNMTTQQYFLYTCQYPARKGNLVFISYLTLIIQKCIFRFLVCSLQQEHFARSF